ncbi:hypothetical protein CPT_Margaery96 [Citrobacter phage Margaery]|uniref:Uncharacterized protein n=1 Tax=Citrobacter phage Margaery TaxID=1701810 RepID=A0A0M4RC21_9CAUD|nr:hypothetical protein CPT_Margaery96 [Citrobacter phage Margaery]ALF01785.1 hypothetical protein CPT_Margaery96 [Citrobacter phage Margaery]
MKYSVYFESAYIHSDVFEWARDLNQNIVEVETYQHRRGDFLCATFESHREFEKDRFLEVIEANKRLFFFDSYEVKS